MSTPEDQDLGADGARYLPVAVPQAAGALLSHEMIAQRALADLARPQGGSLLVYREASLQRYWPHMPAPHVRATSIAEAHALWTTRDFEGVLIGGEIPEGEVQGLAERVEGSASCLRYIQDSIEGVPISVDGGYLWPEPSRPCRIRIGPNRLIRADFGRLREGSSSWHDSMRSFASDLSHLCYLEQQRCLKAPGRLLRRAASMVAWPRVPGPDLAAQSVAKITAP